ncbi:MAG TPA: hypothetical protein VNW06_03230 [Cytophagaceae bacterium]|jgi:hypothetical protein|nr:hypothetical protein [Cytophagaceae bacterium]
MKYRFIIPLAFCLLHIVKLVAQDLPAGAPIHKQYLNTTVLSGLKGEYYFKKNSCVYYSADYNFNQNYRYRVTNSTRVYNRLGVEMNVGGRWYLGGSLSHRLAYDTRLNMATVKGNLTHRGKIGSVQFIKEFSVEYIHHFNTTFFNKNSDIQAGIGAALYKDFKVMKRPLGFLLSYKIILNSNLQYDIYKNRNIDFTKLRIDVFYGITKNIYFGLYAMRDTEYFYPPGTSDAFGNNIYYRQNNVYPIVGATLNIVLHPENIEKYIPGLPLR